MSYEVEFGGDGVVRLIHYQNKVGGGSRVAAEYIEGNIIEGIKFNEMYLSKDDFDVLAQFMEACKFPAVRAHYRTGN